MPHSAGAAVAVPSATSSDIAVELDAVTFGYDPAHTVLDGISMSIFRLIGGQLRPRSGRVVVGGVSVPDLDRDALFALRRRFGVLFQFGALFTDMTVFENVAFALREHTDLPEELVRDLVLMKLHSVGLRGAAQLMPSELSGGMARRVALARAIALDPMLVLYDEPFAGLDPISLGVVGVFESMKIVDYI